MDKRASMMSDNGDVSLKELIKENMFTMPIEGDQFSGKGWEHIVEGVKSSNNILVGEEHFTNEIPEFFFALSRIDKFDNFYIEVDPYSTRLLQQSIEYDDDRKKEFNDKYLDLMSFYAKVPEYLLVKALVNQGVKLLGADQIIMFADRLICDMLSQITLSERARQIYTEIADKSNQHLDQFLSDPQNNSMYFMTPEFSQDLEELLSLSLDEEEVEIIEKMKLSVEIYQKQNHNLRIKLLLNQVMTDYPELRDSKNLFKFGSNHLARGESFLFVHDIGNLMASLARSRFENSFHIMVVGKSGAIGSPFRGFPENPVDPINGFYTNFLTDFFPMVENEWMVFNLRPIRLAIVRNKLKVDNINLERVIKGYDTLVIIPEVTASKHF
ncbi:MAG: hypothetical protein ACXAE3_14140, partial [Candidatus Kariarchaeaceae archaeon]